MKGKEDISMTETNCIVFCQMRLAQFVSFIFNISIFASVVNREICVSREFCYAAEFDPNLLWSDLGLDHRVKREQHKEQGNEELL